MPTQRLAAVKDKRRTYGRYPRAVTVCPPPEYAKPDGYAQEGGGRHKANHAGYNRRQKDRQAQPPQGNYHGGNPPELEIELIIGDAPLTNIEVTRGQSSAGDDKTRARGHHRRQDGSYHEPGES